MPDSGAARAGEITAYRDSGRVSGAERRALMQEYQEVIDRVMKRLLGQADVVAANVAAAGSLDCARFDLLIPEESSPLSGPYFWSPSSKAEGAVLLVDHKQMRPHSAEARACSCRNLGFHSLRDWLRTCRQRNSFC